jgi:hydroxyethylthiazole kinase-like uncharacterized protein yjeF
MLKRLRPHQSEPVYRTASLRAIEEMASHALPSHTLMQRAGRAVARLVQARFPHARRIVVLAGAGNNGGDGLVAATHLQAAGRDVRILACGASSLDAWSRRLPPDAAWALGEAKVRQIPCVLQQPPHQSLPAADLYVDALLGIGLTGPVRDAIAAVISALNAQTQAPVLSVDLPSGLDADRGTCGNVCVRATVTLSLLGLKPGLCTGPAASRCGEVWSDDLDLPSPPADSPPDAVLLGADHVRPLLPKLLHAAHKGDRGDVIVVGGAPGMTGAALLAARAAARLGAGRVFVGLQGPNAPGVDPVAPELMLRPPQALLSAARKGGCLVFGPGAGTEATAGQLLAQALAQPVPLVLDADGLNLLAQAGPDPDLLGLLRQRSAATVLTPHPLEAARLLGIDAGQVQRDRLQAAQDLAERYGAWVVLKGAGSVIASPQRHLWINPTGNGLLATAGSGDVLAGAIAAVIGTTSTVQSLLAAVWLHGRAADLAAAQHGSADFTAECLPQWMAKAWAEIE